MSGLQSSSNQSDSDLVLSIVWPVSGKYNYQNGTNAHGKMSGLRTNSKLNMSLHLLYKISLRRQLEWRQQRRQEYDWWCLELLEVPMEITWLHLLSTNKQQVTRDHIVITWGTFFSD